MANDQTPNVQDCACLNLRQASRTVTQAYDNALRPHGLRATQFSLLAALQQNGEAPLSKLAQALVMDRTTLTRGLTPLKDKGLIATSNDDDARVTLVSLTPAGRNLFIEALPSWQAAQERFVSNLGNETWETLLQALNRAVKM